MDRYEAVIIIPCIFAVVLFFVIGSQQPVTQPPQTQINNATVINNYYCNITYPINGTVPIYGEKTESVVITETATPSPTPTLWNDTRRESVGLPADGCGNPCCQKCTPTPTPTITEACEFPWWCSK